MLFLAAGASKIFNEATMASFQYLLQLQLGQAGNLCRHYGRWPSNMEVITA